MANPKRRAVRLDRTLKKALETSKAPAISRAAAVLRLLGKSETPLSLQRISSELGLVPSTCLYALRALVAEEFVYFDADTKRYALEVGVLTLARHWLRRDRFNDQSQPVLDRISRDFDVSALGVHIVGLEHIIVVAVSQAAHSLQVSAQVGSRFPATISATGRCIAAFGNHSEAELEARFATLRWDKPPTLEQWKAQVRKTRENGFAIDDGNYIAGVTVLAAPVWKSRAKLSHALVAIGIGTAVRGPKLPALQDALVSAARLLSKQLCGEIAP